MVSERRLLFQKRNDSVYSIIVTDHALTLLFIAGSFSVFDLRNFQTADASIAPKPLARFHSHRTPITSLQWHPTDESMIAVSDDNGTYVYDLSIEEDDPDHNTNEEENAVEGEIPPQVLFVHSGSEMTKEVHWHPQIPSCIATTSLSGFSVFIPSNL